MKKKINIRTLIIGLVGLTVLGIGGCAIGNALVGASGTKATNYEFTTLRRGTIEKTVSSSGSLEPVATVSVLPQMSGRVEEVFVDYNDEVKKGDILARLNTDTLKLQRQQKSASVQTAQANYELQLVTYQTQEKLAAKNLISEYDLRSSKTQLNAQAASLSSAQADLAVIETEINQYAYITAPIDGVVLKKDVSVGDTVNVSNATSIFTLAENLQEMRIQVGVGELDIGSIYEGQSVRFTVDALPGQNFSGTVQSRRLMPTTSGGTVSYTVIISVDNQDGSLLPGMTCSVDFIVQESRNIVRVPNAALRYQPTSLSATEIDDKVFNATIANMNAEEQKAATTARKEQQQAASSAGTQASGGLSGLMGGGGMPGGAPGGGTIIMGGGMPGGGMPGGAPGANNARAAGGASAARVTVTFKPLWYVNSGGKLDVIMVSVGISDGSYTEVHAVNGDDASLENLSIILKEKV
ncbi:MAG: efflux RND transporter periplasmic adaptor subunit [Treponema sp.]|jgi:HlyD family secretion protein|nr:efflux RND transporter periplasmic adaptor subunit [Treponema sp.]